MALHHNQSGTRGGGAGSNDGFQTALQLLANDLANPLRGQVAELQTQIASLQQVMGQNLG